MLAAAGCGGSSTPKPTGTAANGAATNTPVPHTHVPGDPSASRVIAKADAICRRVNSELTAAPPGFAISQIARSAPRNAALEERAIAELSRIRPPAVLARDWRSIIGYRRILAQELLKLVRYAKANDARAIQTLAASKKRVHQKLSALATRDGFKDCSHLNAARSVGQALRSLGLGQPKGTPGKL
jgi:hypothetical protein